MAIDSPQKRPGTNFIRSSGGADKGSPASVPHTGSEGKDVLTSTNYPFAKENITEDKGGKQIEGQKLRGYVLNDSGPSGGPTEDATVAPDGTRRVKDIG